MEDINLFDGLAGAGFEQVQSPVEGVAMFVAKKPQSAFMNAVEAINSGTLNCPDCKSDIIKATADGGQVKLVCRVCGKEWEQGV